MPQNIQQEKELDVLCVGLAVMDVFISPISEDVFKHQFYRVKNIGISTGGDALNESVMLSKLGNRTALIVRVGQDDMGSLMISKLQKAGVDTSYIVQSEDSVTTTPVALVRPDGQRTIVSIIASNYDFCRDDIHLDQLPKARAMSIGSFFGNQKLEADGGTEMLLKYAKEKGMITFADMAADKLNQKLEGIRRFLPYVDYFLPSYHDAVTLTGLSGPEEMAEVFCRHGAKNVVIKLGLQGAYVYSDNIRERIPTFDVKTVDTTGAGDTFCAGIIHSILKGKDLKEAGTFACAAASFKTQYYGASLAPLTQEAVETIRKEKKRLD
ncbi:MAG: carbohydrate kinase family protein [Christensenellales bacterium]